VPQLQENAAVVPTRASGAWAASAVRLLGELLLTAGIILVFFIAWQLWWTNLESAVTQGAAVKDFAGQVKSVELHVTTQGEGRDQAGPGAPSFEAEGGYGPVPSFPEPADGKMIGLLYVPRFGPDYSRPIVQGTGPAVLDSLGIGHYAGTAMPGGVGNFAVAGHRQTHGAVLDNIDALVSGDKIYVQTVNGFYVYVFRNSQVVLPDRTDVLLPVPLQRAATPTESYLTMTTCNPRFGSQERFVAYALLEQSRPVSAGAPAEIAAQVQRVMRED
jgi:sortase A